MKKIDWPIDALVYELYGLTEEVEKMLSLHKQLPEAATPHERTALQRQIEATDGQIDGGPAVRSDGGGDRDCGGCERIKESDEKLFLFRKQNLDRGKEWQNT